MRIRAAPSVFALLCFFWSSHSYAQAASTDPSTDTPGSIASPEECGHSHDDAQDLWQRHEHASGVLSKATQDGPVKQALKACIDQVRDTYHPCGEGVAKKENFTQATQANGQNPGAQLQAANQIGGDANTQHSQKCSDMKKKVQSACTDQVDGARQELRMDEQREDAEVSAVPTDDPNDTDHSAYNQKVTAIKQKHHAYQTELQDQMKELSDLGGSEQTALDRLQTCYAKMAENNYNAANRSGIVASDTESSNDNAGNGGTPANSEGSYHPCGESDQETCNSTGVFAGIRTAEGAVEGLEEDSPWSTPLKYGLSALDLGYSGGVAGNAAEAATGLLRTGAQALAPTLTDAAPAVASVAAGPVGLAGDVVWLLSSMTGPAGDACDTVYTDALQANANGCTLVESQSATTAVNTLAGN